MPRLRLDYITLLLAAFALLGTGLILLRVAYGVGVIGDAKYYIAVARALSDGATGAQWLMGQIPALPGFIDTEPFPLEISGSSPPLYPALLAGSGGFAFDARDVAGPLNAVIFGMTIFVAGLWLRHRIRSRLLIVVGCAAVLFSAPLVWIASWAMSEALFVLLVTLSLYCFDRFLESEERALLVWAAIFTALACLTRYSGVTLLFVAALLLALQHGAVFSEKARRIGLYLVISVVPLALWLLRNYLVVGSLTGARGVSFSPGGIVDAIARALNAVDGWNPLAVDLRGAILPVDLWTGKVIGAILAGAILLALAMMAAWSILRWRRERRGDSLLPVAGAFAVVYIAFIIVIRASGASGLIGDDVRYIAPAYIPAVLAIVFAADALLRNNGKLPLSARWGRMPVIKNISSRGGVKSRILPAALIVPLVLCVGYAGYVGIRDTHTALFSPEYGWNAYGYNAGRIGIGAESVRGYLQGRVGDSGPAIRAHFDLYVAEGSLIYFRQGCDPDDMENKIFLHVFPSFKPALPGISKHTGFHNLDFLPYRQGSMLDGECLAVAPLPEYGIERIATGQHDFETVFWEVEFVPFAQGTPPP